MTMQANQMNADELRIEMIFSAIAPPYSDIESHVIEANDGAIAYRYETTSYGNIMTSRVISLNKPSNVLHITFMTPGLVIDKKRLGILSKFVIQNGVTE